MQKLTARRLYGIGVLLLVAAMPLKVGGCGRSACLSIPRDQLAKNGGQCPSAQAAQSSFGDCNGTVKGNGELDGTLCCYPIDDSTASPCPVPFTSGGVGGSVGSGFNDGAGAGSSGDGVPFPPPDVVASSVGSGGPPGCSTCQDFLNGIGSPTFSTPCTTNAVEALKDLEVCACTGQAPCATACQSSLCNNVFPSPPCLACIEGATSNCGGPLMLCQVN